MDSRGSGKQVVSQSVGGVPVEPFIQVRESQSGRSGSGKPGKGGEANRKWINQLHSGWHSESRLNQCMVGKGVFASSMFT